MQYIHSKLVGSLNMPILFFWFSNIKDNLSRPLQSRSNWPNSNTDKHNLNELNRPYPSKTFLPPRFATLADSLYATQLLKEREKNNSHPNQALDFPEAVQKCLGGNTVGFTVCKCLRYFSLTLQSRSASTCSYIVWQRWTSLDSSCG